MNKSCKVLIALILCAVTPHISAAQEATKAHRDSLDALVTKYYDLNVQIFQANSTVGDIDETFELFTDDFTYVHPKYGGTYTREELYANYVRNLENGAYNGTVTDIEILNQITGLSAVVVQKRFHLVQDGKVSAGDPEMTLFEFRDGKISRIFEYW